MDFSVVVTSHDEPLYLEAVLHSVRDQSFGESVELIVVDQHGGDETGNIARQYADLVLYAHQQHGASSARQQQGASSARQRGARRASGKHLVFLEADAVMSANLLALAARSLQSGKIGGSAPVRIAESSLGARWAEWVLNTRRRFLAIECAPYLYCTREAFERASGWDSYSAGSAQLPMTRRLRAHGDLAWDRAGCTTTEALPDRQAAYPSRALTRIAASAREPAPIRGLPSVSQSDAHFTT